MSDQNRSPMAHPAAWDHVAEGYLAETAGQLAPFARDAIAALSPAPDARALDVACGPGTASLLLAQQLQHVDAIDFAPAMIAQLRQRCDEQGITNLRAQVMDGQDLSFEDGSFDVALSMFGLMFFPDIDAGLRELHRVLRPGGQAAVSSWVPLDQAPDFSAQVDALLAAMPELPKRKGGLSVLEDEAHFLRAMQDAGFVDVGIRTLRHRHPVASAEAFWASLTRGSVVFALMRAQLGAEAWEQRGRAGIAVLEEALGPFPCEVENVALLAMGRKG